MSSISVNLNPLVKFKCVICDTIPDEIQVSKCSKNHILCILCTFKNGLRCVCGCDCLSTKSNPLIGVLKSKYCPYKTDGCEWVFSETDDINEHTSECKYRPYKCIGTTFNVWKCNWNGLQMDVAEHLKNKHANNCESYKYWQEASVPFDLHRTDSKINIIDAFNKKFIFYYLSHIDLTNVLFIIYLVGRKCDADKFIIDFELKQEFRKIKFNEHCYNDASNLPLIISEQRCFVISKKLVNTYVKNGKIEFRFVLKRKDVAKKEDLQKEFHLKNNVLGQTDDSNNNAAAIQIRGFNNNPNMRNATRYQSCDQLSPSPKVQSPMDQWLCRNFPHPVPINMLPFNQLQHQQQKQWQSIQQRQKHRSEQNVAPKTKTEGNSTKNSKQTQNKKKDNTI